jgi:two-component system alkaline phosphatase synthesis response regulator PhoP
MPKKIMVVDDNKDIRISVHQILEICGYEVIEAEDGMNCLKQLEQGHPDLVILDIMMPGMSGWDVAARIKQNEKWNSIPIVFLTAKGDDMSMGLGGLASEEYIVKPFDVMKLMECVDRILKKS